MDQYVGLKDLARELGCSTRTVKRLWQKHGVPPTIQAHAMHRWSPADKARLLEAIAKDTKHAHDQTPVIQPGPARGVTPNGTIRTPLKPTLQPSSAL
jgi:hypothetical protein